MGATGRRLRYSAAALAALLICATAYAEPPPAVLDVLSTLAQSLASQEIDRFLGVFDRAAPGYAQMRADVGKLIAASGVASTIEPVANSGDADHQQLQLDWLLRTASGESRRQVVKCTLERQGKNWKIVSLEPMSFFKFD